MKSVQESIDISIGTFNIQTSHLYSFFIDQEYNQHHSFECVLYAACLKSETISYTLDESKKWIGKLITFKMAENQLHFEGIICDIYAVFGKSEFIKVTGFSPTILLSTCKGHYQSFADLKLSQLVEKLKTIVGGNVLKWKINKVEDHYINYITLYNEDYFNFLNRLSISFGEFFYYDGQHLNFGKADKADEIVVEYGKDITEFSSSLRVLPITFEDYSYNYRTNQTVQSAPPEISSSNELFNYAYQQSKSLFSVQANGPAEAEFDEQKQLAAAQLIKRKIKASGMINMTGTSSNYSLSIGSHINVSKTEGNNKLDLGKFLITKIRHQFSEKHYQNFFSGTSSDTEALDVKNLTCPVAEHQVGFVIDNNDAEQLGRVKVKLVWQAEGESTDWIRVLTPEAGSEDQGVIFVPMAGDEVIVGFHFGYPDLPFVAGSVFNKNHSAILPQKQSICSAAGTEITFFDSGEERFMKLSDDTGNEISLNTKTGNINIISKGQLHIVGDEEIALESKSVNITATTDLRIVASRMNFNCKTFDTQVAGTYKLKADSIKETAEQDIVCFAKNNMEITSHKDLTLLSYGEDIVLNGKEEIILDGQLVKGDYHDMEAEGAEANE